jgi:hypothetical protein
MKSPMVKVMGDPREKEIFSSRREAARGAGFSKDRSCIFVPGQTLPRSSWRFKAMLIF